MNSHLRRLAAAAAVAAGLPLLGASPAAAHTPLGYDSVYSNKIDYVDSTIYDDARGWARDQWNNSGDVDIQLDTGWTNSDVVFDDQYNSGVSWAGLYDHEPGNDEIWFNTYRMSGYTTAQRRHVALHELGHALGLGHSYTGQVMQPTVGSIQYVQPHDQADYDDLWG